MSNSHIIAHELKIIAAWHHSHFTAFHEECSNTLKKAADLLVENDPKLMTLEEVLNSGNKLMWIEIKTANSPELRVLYPTSPYCDNKDDGFSVSFQSGHIQARGLYGKQWRCWTQKPDENQEARWE